MKTIDRQAFVEVIDDLRRGLLEATADGAEALTRAFASCGAERTTYEQYCALVRELHQLVLDGKAATPEAEAIREKMAEPGDEE